MDIDGDKDLDLVVAAAGEGSLDPDGGLDLAFGDVIVFRNDEGTLNRVSATGQIDSSPPRPGNVGHPVADSIAGNSPRFLSYGDLNNDDRIDLVVVNGFSYDPQSNPSVFHEEDISIVFQTGEGGFEKVQTLDISTDITAARVLSTAVGDFNGDGFNDIAVAVQGLNRVDIYWGSREGEFPSLPSQSLEGLQRPTHVVAEDMDLDGLTDLLVADYDASELLVYPQTNQGLEDSPIRIASSSKPQWLAIGDVNADSSPDVLFSIASSNAVQPIFNLGDHQYTAAATVPTNMHISANAPNGLSVAFGKLAIGNLDGDGFADLAIAHFSSGASTHPNLLQTYSTWLGMHPPTDADDLLGNEDYVDFVPGGGGGIPPVSVEPSAATIGHRDPIDIPSFTDNDFTPGVDGGDFANLNVGLPTLPPSQQVLAAEPLNLPKHNYAHPLDVNQDNLVSPLDALHIIAELNSGATMLENAISLTDSSGDGHVSALDALLVVNYLNTNQPDEEYIVRQQITPQNLAQIRDAYVDLLFDAGLSEQLTGMLRMVPFRIVDLPGNVLAQTRDGVITVDINAAGWGWRIDADHPFNSDLTTQEAAGGKRRADLLSTIAHELGHVLGFDEDFDAELSIMQPRLSLGERTVHDQAIQELLLAYERRLLD